MFQRAQVRIPALADPQQLHPTARTRLARHQPEKGGKLSPRAKAPGIAHCRYHGGRDQPPDAGHRGNALTLVLAALPGSDPRLELDDPRRERTQALELPLQLAAQQLRHRRRRLRTEQRCGLRQQRPPTLRYDKAELIQQTAHLVRLHRAHLDPLRADPMQTQHRLLLLVSGKMDIFL